MQIKKPVGGDSGVGTARQDCVVDRGCRYDKLCGKGILHIGNVAGIPQTLRDGLRQDDVKCDIITFYPDLLEQGSDFSHPYSKWVRYCLPIYGALRTYHLLKICSKYDILHFHAFGGLTFYLDYPLWRILGKRVILHYHGTELRRFGKELFFARFAQKRYVSTLDLMSLAPSAVWLPSPIAMVDFPYVGIRPENPDEPIVILNAVASETHGITKKGLGVVREAIEFLKARRYNIDFRGLVGVPYAEALRQYKDADIIIGQTHIGWYGKMEQECMAFGKPVVSYVRPDLVDLLRQMSANSGDLGAEGFSACGGVPIVSFNQDDAVSLADQVESLICDYPRREWLSVAGRNYVERWHDSVGILDTLKQDYGELLK